MLTLHLHKHDLPSDFNPGPSVAIDTEAMGLNHHRDRLCLVQLATPDQVCHLVQMNEIYQAPNLVRLLTNDKITKLFHFARFDVGLLQHTYGIIMKNIYCTKIASKLVRTYTDKHGLKDLCREFLGIDISKEQQTSNWGNPVLTPEQQRYAATDVIHLHALKKKLDDMLVREKRTEVAKACFDFLPTCTQLDIMGFSDLMVFQH